MNTKQTRSKIHDPFEIAPTLLVSPYSMQILDALFRLKMDKLSRYSSALSFCEEFDLVQPKISRVMRAVRAKSVADLRVKISAIGLAWWDSAFRYPPARRQLTPFGNAFESYQSLKSGTLAEMQKVSNTALGPLSVAQKTGFLRSSVATLWVEERSLLDFKKKFRLVPAIGATNDSKNQTLWLATCTRGLTKESIVSNKKILAKSNRLKNYGNINLFRLLYDLSFFDDRSREARNNMIQEIFHED